MPFLSILWSLRTPIAIGLAILSLVGALKWYGHTKYEEGLKKGNDKAAIIEGEFRIEAAKWNKFKEAQEREVYLAGERKKEINKRNLEDLFKKQKANDDNRRNRENEIKANIKPTDTITVPAVFERVYNAAAKGPGVANGDQGDIQVSQDRSGLIDKTRTFDATAFSQVVIGNVEKYNKLSLQCSKLIDIITELEVSYGTNNEGPKGPAGPARGNVSDGASGHQISRPSG